MKQKGFTIIELVVLIVILGILAVTASVKYMNMQRDAKVSTMQGLLGSFKSANSIIYAKAEIKGIANQSANEINNDNRSKLVIDGKDVYLHYGYILPTEWNANAIMNLSSDWTVIQDGGFYNPLYIVPRSSVASGTDSTTDIINSKCYISYKFHRSGIVDGKPVDITKPVYDIEVTGC